MQTKLSIFCDRVMEAGWLMAAILAPLFFNVYSSRVFEPDKISLVRSIALLMAAAWLIKVTDGLLGGGNISRDTGLQSRLRRATQDNPLFVPAAALVIVYLIATVASVAPMITLWGSYQRLQGTYSTFSYIVIFFLAAGTIRTRAQVERVITTVILTSVPISLYGIVEHLKLEFLPWAGDVTLRVTSTMGNPIFVAAYVIMTVPLAMGRFLDRTAAFMDKATGDDQGNGRVTTRALLASVPFAYAILWFLIIYFGFGVYGNVLQGKASGAGQVLVLLAALIAQIIAFLLTLLQPEALRKGALHAVSAGLYGAAVLFQVATIVFSQSRGPQLGFLAGVAVFIWLYAMKRSDWGLWYAGLATAAAALIFLIVVNLPGSPLAGFRDVPYVGRLATIIEEGGSTRVRSLIWQGARQLIGWHEPIGIPGVYADSLNLVRPLIGYGPEAMYVAYNRFYPPDLAHYEARNASPDRSHNETFDALVTTGILGYFAYWVVFYTAIYLALRHLGVVEKRHGPYLYAALLVAGLLALVLIYGNVLPISLTPGPPLLGAAVLALYLVAAGIRIYDWKGSRNLSETVVITVLMGWLVILFLLVRDLVTKQKGRMRPLDLILISLVSAVVAHFVEIQFGIAIASTRTHFWLYAALIVAAGRLMEMQEATEVPAAAPAPAERAIPAAAPARQPAETSSFKKKKGKKVVATGRPGQQPRQEVQRQPVRRTTDSGLGGLIGDVLPNVLPLAVVGGIIMTTMAFDFIIPQSAQTQSIRTAPMQTLLYFSVFMLGGLLAAFDGMPGSGRDEIGERIVALFTYAVVSLGMWVVYRLVRNLVSPPGAAQVDPIGLVVSFYAILLVYGLLLVVALYVQRHPGVQRAWSGSAAALSYALVPIVALVLAVTTNLNVVLADVHYKTGQAYDNAQRWDGSINAYQEALRLTPSQDFYYLFLGRAFMEMARQYPDRTPTPPYDPATEPPATIPRERLAALGRIDLIKASRSALEDARSLNPLNTDHYANLGRLHRFWGEVQDQSKFEIADTYFQQATTLSPNNAQLWNEWAIVSILRGRIDEAQAKLQHSLELDDRYDMTYFYLANLYMNIGESAQDDNEKRQFIEKAVEAYSSCLQVNPAYWECAKARGYLYGKYQNKLAEAIADFEKVAAALPKPEELNRIANANERERVRLELVNVNQNLAITYGQVGQMDLALARAQTASQLAPNDQALKNLVEQLKAQQKK